MTCSRIQDGSVFDNVPAGVVSVSFVATFSRIILCGAFFAIFRIQNNEMQFTLTIYNAMIFKRQFY